MKIETKFRVGKYLIPVSLSFEGDRIWVFFRYHKGLIEEIKNFQGAKWHGFDKEKPIKAWSITNSQRNLFQIAYLEGKNPYAWYDKEIIKNDYERPLYFHQKEMADFIISKRQCIVAGEMGVGKTLSVQEAIERSGIPGTDWWYVAPKSALKAVQREFRIWQSKVWPRFMTYENLVKEIKNWVDGMKAPKGIVFDESVRIKNPTSQRSQAAKQLADGVRADWGKDGYIILMSGAPAPKSPADWWGQAETACPGFVREGDIFKFKRRLAIIQQKEDMQGGVYPQLVSWKDDERKCEICGKYPEDHQNSVFDDDNKNHSYKPSKNEVSYLYERLKGLVIIHKKKDCLDLPEKIYRHIILEPTQKTLNLARSIVNSSPTTIQALTRIRELSDGFQYLKKSDDTIITKQIESPKEEALIDLLDELSDVGRIVIYAGFTGSVDRCVDICKRVGWQTIRADGRGWLLSESIAGSDPLDIFQGKSDEHIAFIAQAGAAGTGLTLTASPMIIYYSNDFDADHRIQSEDRIHRPGMDLNRGATIVDLIHLPTDQLILDNLQAKRALQALTLGEIQRSLN